MGPRITVVGSSNTDLIVKLPRLPIPGETIIGGTFFSAAGGKGANQVVAAARAGGEVTFISRVGRDQFGIRTIENLKGEGVNIDLVEMDDTQASGIALILVDQRGENSIGVSSGANAMMTPAAVERSKEIISSSDVLLAQLEIPVPVVQAAIRIASRAGAKVILNPAPAQELDSGLYPLITILTPNEIETEKLTGIPLRNDRDLSVAAGELLERGLSAVVITLGERGAFFADRNRRERIEGFRVKAADTTAAGDVFNGALAVAIGEGSELRDAIKFANAAAAISVTRLGAQPSAPRRSEIDGFLRSGSQTFA